MKQRTTGILLRIYHRVQRARRSASRILHQYWIPGNNRELATVFFIMIMTHLPKQITAQTTLCTQGGQYEDPVGTCNACPAGHGCPVDVHITAATLPAYECPAGQYQELPSQVTCIVCPANTECPGTGRSDFTECPAGETTPPGSTSCSGCGGDADYFFDGLACTKKTVCNPDTEYEDLFAIPVLPGNRVCKPLTQCDTTKKTELCTVGGNGKMCDRLEEYIVAYHTATTDRVCISSEQCPADHYVFQEAVADGAGYLVKPQICRAYTTCDPGFQYTRVDGRATEDQDNVCSDVTICTVDEEYELTPLDSSVIPGKVFCL